jgi:hypothetical protein
LREILRGKLTACRVHTGTLEDTEIDVELLQQVIPLHMKTTAPYGQLGSRRRFPDGALS